MDIKSNIINALKEVISKEIGKEIDIKLDKTPNLELGDYSVNICFRLAKELKKNPNKDLILWLSVQ